MAKEWWEDAPVVETTSDWWQSAPLVSPEPEKPVGVIDSALGAVKRWSDDYFASSRAEPEPSGVNSVLANTTVKPEALPTTSSAPVTPEFRQAIYNTWDAADTAKRVEMQGAPGLTGQLARDRAGQYAQFDQQATPTEKPIDTRVEARRAALAQSGEAPAFADRAALESAQSGVLPGSEVAFERSNYGLAGPTGTPIDYGDQRVAKPGSDQIAEADKTEVGALDAANRFMVSRAAGVAEMATLGVSSPFRLAGKALDSAINAYNGDNESNLADGIFRQADQFKEIKERNDLHPDEKLTVAGQIAAGLAPMLVDFVLIAATQGSGAVAKLGVSLVPEAMTAAQMMGDALIHGASTMKPVAVMAFADTYQRALESGQSRTEAMNSSLPILAKTSLFGAMPMSARGSTAMQLGSGAVLNAANTELERVGHNLAYPDQQIPYDSNKLLADLAVGAAMGKVGGRDDYRPPVELTPELRERVLARMLQESVDRTSVNPAAVDQIVRDSMSPPTTLVKVRQDLSQPADAAVKDIAAQPTVEASIAATERSVGNVDTTPITRAGNAADLLTALRPLQNRVQQAKDVANETSMVTGEREPTGVLGARGPEGAGADNVDVVVGRGAEVAPQGSPGPTASLRQAQSEFDTWREGELAKGNPTPVVNFAEPAPDVAPQTQRVREGVSGLLGVDPESIAFFSDPRKGSTNGLLMNDVAYINTAGLQLSATQVGLHEAHHVIELIAKANDQQGLSETPAQNYRDKTHAIFDDVSDAGKRAYVTQFLFKPELDAMAQKFKDEGRSAGYIRLAQEYAVKEYMNDPLLRSEMAADFVGNRANDSNFWQSLVKADPVGFKSVVAKWLDLVNGLLTKLRGDNANKQSLAVDSYIQNIEQHKANLADALVRIKNEGMTGIDPLLKEVSASARQVTDNTTPERGVVGEVAPNPDLDLVKDWRAMSFEEQRKATTNIVDKVVRRIAGVHGAENWETVFSTGRYEGETNHNFIIKAPLDAPKGQIHELARALGFTLNQKSMVVFDEHDTSPDHLAGFVKVVLPKDFSAEQLQLLRDHLKSEGVNDDTLKNGRLIFGNFRDPETKQPFSGLSDKEFRQKIFDAVNSFEPTRHTFDVDHLREYNSQLIWPDSREDYLKGTRYGSEDSGLGGRGASVRDVGGSSAWLRSLADDTGQRLSNWIDASPTGRASRNDTARQAGLGSVDRSTVAAEYGTPREGSVSAIGHHFSESPRATLLSEAHGRGAKGAEAERLREPGNSDIRDRTYFYVDKGQGIHPEAGVGGVDHVVRLNNLYDTNADHLGIVKNSKGANESALASNTERAIVKAGFDGYVHDNGGNQKFAVLLGKHTIPMREAPRMSERELFKDYDVTADFKDDIKAKLKEIEQELWDAGMSVAGRPSPRGANFSMTSPAAIKAAGFMAEKAYPKIEYVQDGNHKRGEFSVDGEHYRVSIHDTNGPNHNDQALENNAPTSRGMPIRDKLKGLSEGAREGWNQRYAAAADLFRRGFDLYTSVPKAERENIIKVWKAIAENPDAFEFNKTTLPKGAKNLEQVAQNLADQLFARSKFSVAVSVNKGEYHLSIKDNATGVISNAHLTYEPHDRSMGVHVALANKGSSAGKVVYQLASEFANALKSKIEADPKGLMGVNNYRRTEQSFSGMLRTGNYDVIHPGAGQRVYGWNERAKTPEQMDRNLARIALANLRNVMEIAPSIEKFSYDMATDRFTLRGRPDTIENRLIAGARIKKLLDDTDVRTMSISRSTLARAAITLDAMNGKVDVPGHIEKPVLYSERQGPADIEKAKTDLGEWAYAYTRREAGDLPKAMVVAKFGPPPMLKMAGLPTGKVYVTKDTLYHIEGSHHAVDPDVIAKLPNLLMLPRAVIVSYERSYMKTLANGKVIKATDVSFIPKEGYVKHIGLITSAFDVNGDPYMVAFKPNGSSSEITNVVTMFGQERSLQYVLGALNQGAEVFAPEKEIARLRAITGSSTIPREPQQAVATKPNSLRSEGDRPPPNHAIGIVYGTDAVGKFMSGGDWKTHGEPLLVSDAHVAEAGATRFSEKQAALDAKFERLSRFHQERPALMERIHADALNGREEAAILRLIDATGFRIGGKVDLVEGKEAFGASTLRSEHVSVKGDDVTFSFTGKAGVAQRHTITDPVLARDLEVRLAQAKPQLFSKADRAVRKYLDSIIGDADYKLHDWRSWNATEAAKDVVDSLPLPENAAQYKAAIELAGSVAAVKIGDTLSVTLEHYVSPKIFARWRESAGIADKPRVQKGTGEGAPIDNEATHNGTAPEVNGRTVRSENKFSVKQDESPIWRSALRDGVESLPYKQLPVSAWGEALKSLVNKGKVKADEIEWSGINDWLKMQQGRVTKDQVRQFIDGNGVPMFSIRQALTSISKTLDKVGEKTGIYDLVAPMSNGTDQARAIAQTWINKTRTAQYTWGKIDNVLTKHFTQAQREKMWNAADQENDIRRAGGTSVGTGRGLDSLPPDERTTLDTLHTYANELWQRAKDVGMVSGEGVDYWTPRMMTVIGASGEYAKPGDGGGVSSDGVGRNFTSSGGGSTKQRKYELSADTEAAMIAKGGELVRDIRTMPLAMSKLEKGIAGRELINQIKALGTTVGRNLVSNTADPEFFTLNHPAFKTYTPELTEHSVPPADLAQLGYVVQNGKVMRQLANGTFKELTSYHIKPDGSITQLAPRLDETGGMVMVEKPIYISNDFKGPLKAILSQNLSTNGIYTGYMLLKSKAMSAIMYSPLIHNMVILGRALAYGGLKTPMMYFTGYAAKNDVPFMQKMIDAGMVPIGSHNNMLDIGDIAEGGVGRSGGWRDPNESWIALASQHLGNKTHDGLGDRIKAGIDTAGDFWHNTMLWERVGDLQAGIAKDVFDKLTARGIDDNAATTAAAHIANRYAGAIGKENMSELAHMAGNILLFSKSFNAGNVGTVKDAFYGLPAGLKAQLFEKSSAVDAEKAMAFLKSKARWGLVRDAAYAIVLTSLVQDWMKRDKDKSFAEQLSEGLSGYRKRAVEMWANLQENPTTMDSYNPHRLSSTWNNEPGKQDRVDMGRQEGSERHEYMRLPTGKVFEDIIGWVFHFADTAGKKKSPLVSALQRFTNVKDPWGTPVWDSADSNSAMIFDLAKALVQTHAPIDQGQTLLDVAQGHGTAIDKSKLLGNITGFTTSQGDPRGPEGAVVQEQLDRLSVSRKYIMEYVKHDLKVGNVEKAQERLENIGLTQREINKILHRLESPTKPISRSQLKRFIQHATPEELRQMESVTQ